MTMTANKNASVNSRAGGSKVPQDTLDRCHSVSPPPLLSPRRSPAYPLSDSEDSCRSTRLTKASSSRLRLKDWSSRTSTLRSTSTSPSDTDSPSHPLKAVSVGTLDKRLSVFKAEDQKESQKEAQDGEAIGSHLLARSTLSLGTATNLRNLSLSRASVRSQALDIRQKITEWECRREPSPRMSGCVDKRDGGERSGSESCPSVLTSPCSEKTFDFKGLRRMSRTFSECSYPETEEEELLDRDSCHRFEKRSGRSELPSAAFLKGPVRKESSAVLNRIQKIEQALKEQPGRGLPQLPSSCYSVDKGRKKSVTLSTVEGLSETLSDSKGGSVILGSEPETPAEAEKSSKTKQGVTANSAGSKLLLESPANTAVNPVPKPKRTFEYEADKNHKSKPSNGLPPSPTPAAPPPLPSTPAPPVTRRQKKESRFHRKSQNRKSFEFEDASSLQSLYPPSPTENGTESQHKFGSKSTLEENAYEDIVGESPKENPYEDVELKARHAGRKSHQLSENSLDSLHRMWTPQDRKYTSPPQLPSKPSSQSLRIGNWSERKSHRLPRLPKRHSHDDMLLLAQLGIPSSPSSLNEDSLSTTSELLSTRRARRIPKLVQRINSIYSAKRGKKRLKKLSMSNIETASLRDENSESESDSDDRFKAHTQRLVHIQSMLKRAPSYRTLELELIEWQERELFEYFVVVSLKKKPSKNTYLPEVTYQFPKLERPTKQMREAEERLKAIPQFCFPDAKDWLPVSEYNRYEALAVEGHSSEDMDDSQVTPEVAPRPKKPMPRVVTTPTKKKRRVTVVGDSLLKGTEGPICRADPPLREVCCLPGARVKDIARKLPSLVHPSDYYPLLLLHVGGDEAETRTTKAIKRDFRVLGQSLKDLGAQVIFASLLPVKGSNGGWNRQPQSINAWLHGWCRCHNFGFFDNGAAYMAPGLMSADGIHLSQRGKRIFVQELAGLIDGALN
nr:PREDICTED: suppression of tumorigenicity 5 protein-like [Balearica regulorum gibbericeps]